MAALFNHATNGFLVDKCITKLSACAVRLRKYQKHPYESNVFFGGGGGEGIVSLTALLSYKVVTQRVT